MADGEETLVVSAEPSERTDRGQGTIDTQLGWLQRQFCRVVETGPMPKHIGFIMDGNRRFAREQGVEVAEGHRLGYGKLEEALRWCCELGVKAVTVYAFSIQNFQRSCEEVGALMALCEEKLRHMCGEDSVIQQQGVRVRVVGDLSLVSQPLRQQMHAVMRDTQGNSRHVLTICFSYTSRNEIAAAVQKLGTACLEQKLLPGDIREELLERCLYTCPPGCPPVDLIVRTSGEKRLSDFLLWQSSKCCVVFTQVLWPELSLYRFLCVLVQFQRHQPALSSLLRRSTPPHEEPFPSPRASTAVYLLLFALLTAVFLAIGARVHAGWSFEGIGFLLGAWLSLVGYLLLQHSRAASPSLKGDGGARELSATKYRQFHSAATGDAGAQRVRDFVAELNIDKRL
ncbi:hypothetical protein AB1Y20_019813 [Prymnesium parvum]|uniref:Alkyl transferase n=1 Tax=Prymnesium parvum TaxID=97485 RepID=A0AB34JVI7_PRYPA|mmetsp:Transcript_24330/g.60331  ORF Transcript_24330/g.60331 Transcript_24330/m.60331 type:complete len:398 (-) Transcript_24330:364-1557(-)